jgi:nucleotide-binding universal stress UspA family protein
MIYMIAIDGSPESHTAYEVAVGGLIRETDKFFVVHISNCKKTYLPPTYTPYYITEYYNALITEYGVRANFIIEELEYGLSTKEHINKLAKILGAHVIVVGMHGRKGHKE